MEEQFSCIVCGALPVDVVEASCCSSLFCWECAINTKNLCPSCKVIFDREACKINLPLRRAIENVPRKCKYENCTKMLKGSEEIRQHSLICPEKPVVCPNSDLCGILVSKDLDNHLTTKCEYRMVSCHLCDIEILFKNLPAHLEQDCKGVTVQCPNKCSAQVKRKELEEHIQTECPFEKITCEFSFCGCLAQFKRMDAADHSENAVVIRRHLNLLAKYSQKQNEEIKKQQEEIKQLQTRTLCCTQSLKDFFPFIRNNLSKINFSSVFSIFVIFLLYELFFDLLVFGIFIGSISAIRPTKMRCRSRLPEDQHCKKILPFLYFMASISFLILVF